MGRYILKHWDANYGSMDEYGVAIPDRFWDSIPFAFGINTIIGYEVS